MSHAPGFLRNYPLELYHPPTAGDETTGTTPQMKPDHSARRAARAAAGQARARPWNREVGRLATVINVQVEPVVAVREVGDFGQPSYRPVGACMRLLGEVPRGGWIR
jgi:hypothetical protein